MSVCVFTHGAARISVQDNRVRRTVGTTSAYGLRCFGSPGRHTFPTTFSIKNISDYLFYFYLSLSRSLYHSRRLYTHTHDVISFFFFVLPSHAQRIVVSLHYCRAKRFLLFYTANRKTKKNYFFDRMGNFISVCVASAYRRCDRETPPAPGTEI